MVVCKASSKPTSAEHRDIHYRLRTTTVTALAQAQLEEAAGTGTASSSRSAASSTSRRRSNAASDDTDIFVLPGVYREEPSRAAPTAATPAATTPTAVLVRVPRRPSRTTRASSVPRQEEHHDRGTGVQPEDVLIDVGFVKDVGLRCDRCTGFIIRNLWQRDANEHGIYVVDSDGYIFDRTRGSYNKEYSLFSFASDNGLYTDCDARAAATPVSTSAAA
jgi:hypothetical protein